MKTFDELWPHLKEDSLNPEEKYRNIYHELLNTYDLKGHTAEIGVYKGHTSKMIHMLCDHKTHYCYDTFEGIALADPSIDFHGNNEFSCSLENVKNFLGEDNIVYKVGIFPNTFNEHNEWFSFVHSDTDTYAGTQAAFDYFAKRIVLFGKIFLNDYKWKNCEGVEKAVKEFLANNDNFLLKEYENQCVLLKIFE